MSNITNISIYLKAGDVYTMHVPVNMANNMGYFPRKGSIIKENGDPVTFQNGFYVENEEVGTIIKVHTDKVAIDYRHLLPVENTIWFHAITGERARVIISNIQVHDHSSIITGGPAFGTYFTGETE